MNKERNVNSEIDNQNFIDINIDSECESSTDTINNDNLDENNNISNKNGKKLFNFTKKKSMNDIKQNDQINQLNSVKNTDSIAEDKISLNQAADILLSNLSDIGLDTDEDDVDKEESDDDELKTKNNFTNTNYNSNNINNNDNGILKKNSFDFSSLDSVLHDFNFKHDSIFNSSTFSVYQNQNNSKYEANDENNMLNIDKSNQSTPLPSNSLNSFDKTNNFKKNITLNYYDNDDLLNELDKALNEDKSNKYKKQPIDRSSSDCLTKTSNTKTTRALTQTNSLGNNNNSIRNDSLVDGLLGDIYDRFNVTFKENFDSDVFTDLTLSSSRFSGIDHDTESNAEHESESKHYSKNYKFARSNLQNLDMSEIKQLINEMSTKINQISAKLIRQLKHKDKLASKLNRNCDIITALLQAKSQKRSIFN